MPKQISKNNLSLFEQIRQTDAKGNEFWMARQLAKVLDYADFRNFVAVINKAIEACKNSNYDVKDHLVKATEVVAVGSGATHSYPSYI